MQLFTIIEMPEVVALLVTHHHQNHNIINFRSLGERSRINMEDTSKVDSHHQVVIPQKIDITKIVHPIIIKVDSLVLVVATIIITEVILLWILVIRFDNRIANKCIK